MQKSTFAEISVSLCSGTKKRKSQFLHIVQFVENTEAIVEKYRHAATSEQQQAATRGNTEGTFLWHMLIVFDPHLTPAVITTQFPCY